MKQIYYGQLDLTKVGQIVKQHPELVREIPFKDGVHKLINIQVFGKEQADKYNNTACVKASVKRDQEIQGVPYFIADLKDSATTGPKSNIDAPLPNTSDDPFSW